MVKENIWAINGFRLIYGEGSVLVNDVVHQYEKALDARYVKEIENDRKTKMF